MKNILNPRQRGAIAEGYIWLIGAIVVILVLTGLVVAAKSFIADVEKKGYERGKKEVEAKWGDADREANAKHALEVKRLQGLVDDKERERQAAATSASNWETKWKEITRENDRKKQQLAACVQQPGPASGGGASPADVRFTWLFVDEYNAAWTGGGGQPVFADSSERIAASPGSSALGVSPYGPDDLLDIHGENARRFGACLRDFNALIDKVSALRDNWGK